MTNTINDLKSLLLEIPMVSNLDAHEKLKCILVLYSKMLVNMVHVYKVSDYFSNLHIMSYDMKSIMNNYLGEDLKHAIYQKTRDMLIRDLYNLIEVTSGEVAVMQ